MSPEADDAAERSSSFNGFEKKPFYSLPLASYEDVVKTPVLFWDSLRRFHSTTATATKFMIPVIGGKELDLHVLFVEVTGRGGYKKVVEDKKWKEVGVVFKFPSSTTSASFVLKKHYFSLLYHYEQIYFFRLQAPLHPPIVVSPISYNPEWAIGQYSPPNPKIRDCRNLLVEGTGTIDGKFDCGYLVSVKLGSEILKGVLYHIEEPSSSATIPDASTAIVSYTSNHNRIRRIRRRKSRNRRLVDPSYPKPNISGYNFFFAEKYYKLKSMYPNREREFTKMIGESWSHLSSEDKMVYQDIGVKDKERYKRELNEYKEKMKLEENNGIYKC